MARMYPASISPHTQSPAEKLLFREFQHQLPDDYIVMHGVGWVSRRRQWNDAGEADFVIIHPRRGVLVLEVKGGRITGEWSSETWVSIDRHGTGHAIKNPFIQADRSMWELKNKLEENPSTRPFRYEYFRGVALPDMLVAHNEYGVTFDRQMVIDSTDINALPRGIERMFSVQPLKEPLPRDAVNSLVRLLQPTFEIQRRGLATEVKTGDEHILTLSQDQMMLLEFLQHQRQAVINGCSGSGKTLLAIEKAIRLSEQGFDVLLTCYNKNLSAWMRSIVNRQPRDVAARIRANHYHDLAVQLCQEAGMPTTVRSNDQGYWDEGLSEDLANATPHLPTRFDAIVADEGQDFASSWWITLSDLLRDPGHGVFYIFQDECQAIYQRDTDLPFAAAPFALHRNFRSSSTIHEHVIRYFEGDPKPVSTGPTGRPIEYPDPVGKTVRESLRLAIATLMNEEGIQPHQVVVLSPHSESKSAIREGDRIGNLTLTWAVEPGPSQIRVSSIHSFKGLESDVVVLAETDRLTTARAANRLAYVALSRAKHHLIVIGNLPAP